MDAQTPQGSPSPQLWHGHAGYAMLCDSGTCIQGNNTSLQLVVAYQSEMPLASVCPVAVVVLLINI